MERIYELNPLIYKVEAAGDIIQKMILEDLSPAVEGKPVSHAVLAMLTFSVMLMKPDVTVEQLQDCVMGASSYIVTYLSENSGKGDMN